MTFALTIAVHRQKSYQGYSELKGSWKPSGEHNAVSKDKVLSAKFKRLLYASELENEDLTFSIVFNKDDALGVLHL